MAKKLCANHPILKPKRSVFLGFFLRKAHLEKLRKNSGRTQEIMYDIHKLLYFTIAFTQNTIEMYEFRVNSVKCCFACFHFFFLHMVRMSAIFCNVSFWSEKSFCAVMFGIDAIFSCQNALFY